MFGKKSRGSSASSGEKAKRSKYRYAFFIHPDPATEDETEVEEAEHPNSLKRRRNLRRKDRASKLKSDPTARASRSGGTCRRMARFDWTAEEPPRPLAPPKANHWLLLNCLWYEHNISRETEPEQLSGSRNPWRSCLTPVGFNRAWEELSQQVDEDITLPAAFDERGDRKMRCLLHDRVAQGLWAPPSRHRFNGDNFDWLSAVVFEQYQDFCLSKLHLWGRSAVER